jgi:hypothetical protein
MEVEKINDIEYEATLLIRLQTVKCKENIPVIFGTRAQATCLYEKKIIKIPTKKTITTNGRFVVARGQGLKPFSNFNFCFK